MIDVRAVVATSLVASVLLGGAFAFSLFVRDDARTKPGPDPNLREANWSRFNMESHLVRLRREPLAWSCQAGSPDRIRYLSEACGGDYLVEATFSNDRRAATIELLASHAAAFTDAKGLVVKGPVLLDRHQVRRMRAAVTEGFVRLPSFSPDSQLPAAYAVIEACMDGRAHAVVRNTQSDPAFAERESQLREATGLNFTYDKPFTPCL